jgi:hypothetical protein
MSEISRHEIIKGESVGRDIHTYIHTYIHIYNIYIEREGGEGGRERKGGNERGTGAGAWYERLTRIDSDRLGSTRSSRSLRSLANHASCEHITNNARCKHHGNQHRPLPICINR